ncbi:LuxR C-terminal-related transcriptional regulator [Streptomyces sp. R28]|uniref:LuxR C-terminal-related transcriptional regulator n=1 Tax=Streptomyces sp. R28 TaxID=3238628 RepID=A0AB39Q339_9ACTN
MTLHPEHRAEDLCPAGTQLYEQALRKGRIHIEDLAPAPCLVDCGLLHPTVEDSNWLEPVAPIVALHELLRASEERIASEWRRKERLAGTFAPLMRISTGRPATADTSANRLLSSSQQINQAISRAMAEAQEALSVQPVTHKSQVHEAAQPVSLDRDQALLDRGGRIRTLYQHTQRHVPFVIARYEQLKGDVEARTLDEVTDRLIVIDRSVAFIPVSNTPAVALEVRHPALIAFFVTTFERLWRLATPMYPEAVQPPSLNGVTPRQRAIAALLVEGHTDAAIADRLGMNIRTARVHIAKLAAALGSESRAQLGYLIGQSGILDQEG